MIDMHIHTTASDGTFTPKDIVKLSKQKNIKAIAITDHDTIDGIYEAVEEGKNLDIEVIPGIEFSTLHNDREIHILGYFIDYNDSSLINTLKNIQNSRNERNIKIVNNLRNIGIDITIDDVENMANGDIITRAHFAKVLIEKGYVKDKKQAFSDFLSSNRPGYVKREGVTPKICIETIIKSGGVSFLAHPTLYKMGYSEIEELVIELKQYGLCGIEAEYYSYTNEQEKNIKKIANKYNLLMSGGSDFHGGNRADVELGTGFGNLNIRYDYINAIKDYINKRSD